MLNGLQSCAKACLFLKRYTVFVICNLVYMRMQKIFIITVCQHKLHFSWKYLVFVIEMTSSSNKSITIPKDKWAKNGKMEKWKNFLIYGVHIPRKCIDWRNFYSCPSPFILAPKFLSSRSRQKEIILPPGSILSKICSPNSRKGWKKLWFAL